MLKIIIIEDNTKHLEMISSYICEYLAKKGIEGRIILATNSPDEVCDYIINGNDHPNVFFIDIDLKAKINGLELAYKIKQLVSKAYIVFITQHIKYLQSAFSVHAFDFLPKPMKKGLLNKCLTDINNELEEESINSHNGENRLIIKSGYKDIYIKKSEVLFIEKVGNKALINTTAGQYLCYLSLGDFEKLLISDGTFIRCHKSIIVNKDYIKEIRFNKLEIELITGKICSIGRKYRKEIAI